MSSLEKLVVAYDLSENLMTEEDFLQSEVRAEYSDYEAYTDCEVQFLWEDFCEQVGERLVNMGGKVQVKGYNLDWRGSDGEKTIEVDTTQSLYKVGRSFLFQVCKSIEYAYVEYVGKYDTKKSFTLTIPTHDCVMFFEVKRKR